jgi:hypothetical protein
MGFEPLITFPIFQVSGAKLFFPKSSTSRKSSFAFFAQGFSPRFLTAASQAFDFLT